MVFRGLLVARLHIKQGQIGVDKLFVRPEFLGLVPFGDGGRIIAFAAVSHADGKLGVKMGRVCGKECPELCDGGIVIARAEIEHRVVVLFLERRHKSFDNHSYRTIVMAAQADCEWDWVNGLSYDPEVDACVLDELAAERKGLLEKENAELEKRASQLAEEIKGGRGIDANQLGYHQQPCSVMAPRIPSQPWRCRA